MHIRRKRGLKPITKVGVFYLFVSLGISLVSTIWAIYLDSFLHNASSVGLLTSLFTIVGIFSYLFLIPLVERKSKTGLLISSVVFFLIAYFVFSLYSNIYLVIILGIFLAIFASLRVSSFGLLVRDKTDDGEVSKNEGIVYSLLNAAWLVGPLIAGYLSRTYGFSAVFMLASVLLLTSLISLKISKVADDRISKKVDRNIFKIIIDFFSDKNRVIAYIVGGAVNIWWALIYVYVPVYIVESGYSGFLVGLFLAAVIVPLVSLEYLFGRLAGRKGFRKLFVVGFALIAGLSIACFFVSNIYVILSLLVLASVGAAMVESTTEAYFFDVIKIEQRDKYYGVYNTAIDSGYFVGVLPAALILALLPFKSIFVYFGLMMLIVSLLALKMKEIYEIKKPNTKF